jgi:undecaprenyl phosphate-alpha-L-ara4FN deformylase
LLPAMERLIQGWKDQGYTLSSTADYVESLDKSQLPYRELQWGEIAGRSGTMVKPGQGYLRNLNSTLRR